MDADGSNQKLISETEYPELNPRLSPDGSKRFEVRTEDETYVLYVMDADGTNEKLIATEQDNPFTGEDIFNVRWSPDSEKLLYEAGTAHRLIVVNADGSNSMQVSSDTGEAAWSPDGNKIVHTVVVNEGPDPSGDFDIIKQMIFVINAGGDNLRQLTPRMWLARELSWSPDGALILFDGLLNKTDTAGNLFVVNITSGELTNLTNYVGTATQTSNIQNPTWSPDGHYIAFRRGYHEYPGSFTYRWDIFVITNDGQETVNITATLTEGRGDPNPIHPELVPDSAAWSPDSKELVFWAADSEDGRSFIYVVRLR
jgi:Tol biopolymer transport system component